jgi:lipopolysaccharide transport system permease protein
MYATPVIYPLSTLPEKWKWLLLLNPMTSIIETIRYGFFGTGSFEYLYLAIGTGITAVILLIGIIIFNVVERTFMDTV